MGIVPELLVRLPVAVAVAAPYNGFSRLLLPKCWPFRGALYVVDRPWAVHRQGDSRQHAYLGFFFPPFPPPAALRIVAAASASETSSAATGAVGKPLWLSLASRGRGCLATRKAGRACGFSVRLCFTLEISLFFFFFFCQLVSLPRPFVVTPDVHVPIRRAPCELV